ncbi:GNAT family N-acetyltransferase [Bacillus sp. AGMB 02131]|uniref:GNAT family N-acetyltransferase n=1 Tax=Peribacillus faecalis TaxID=2772559 RepID=A0A927CXB6_9BACI|nr:GNAT family N-acetyltransferase [Peribacillus faecalis]MBD3109306.1 GNAT family N-acetyltransferase [Peribacillus faecalis]
MNATITRAASLEELSRFLSELNQQKQSHIGYCGERKEEIYEALKKDFIDENGELNFLVARNDIGEIIAGIGVDAYETSGEVWGPFSKSNSVELQYRLWERLVKENPNIQSYYFFINEENKVQQSFMVEINATKTGKHLTLKIKRQNFQLVSEIKSSLYIQSEYQAFAQLHHETFPNTYYNAETIIERLGDQCVLMVLKNEENEMLGYAYFEVDCDEASLEYIAIAPNAQNQGLGTRLLQEVLTEIFSYPQLNEIRLCVDYTKKQANHVYMKAGFQPENILISYCLEQKSV